MTHEEAVKLGLDMFYDGKSPTEIRRQLGLKGFNEIESANIFRMMEERERTLDLNKQNQVVKHQEEMLRKRKENEIERLMVEKLKKNRIEDSENCRYR